MRVKLTEEQYNRLLVENDKTFLAGKVNFPHIGNKVSKFIVKLFNYIHQKVGTFKPSNNMEIRDIITRDFGLTKGEAELLGHNYANFSHDTDTDDFSEFILKFWTLITYGFTHFGFRHMLSNIISLFFIGRIFNMRYNLIINRISSDLS